MKKKSILILFLITLFLISFVIAQNPLGEEVDKIKEGKDKIDDTIDKTQNLKSNITQTDFLKQKWEKVLRKNKYFAPIISFFEKISPVLNPIFKYTIGMTPSLSFLFILTIIIWITLVIFFFRTTELVSPFSTSAHYVISIGLAIIISILSVTKSIAEFIINTVSLLEIWWVKLITILVIITIFITASFISKKLTKFIDDEREETELDIAKEKLKSGAKVAETFSEAVTK